MIQNKLISRIKGGIGNQMFIYAASKQVAKINNAKLYIDNITGFKYDKLYNRKYKLDAFNVNINYANNCEMFLPFDKIIRYIFKLVSPSKFLNENHLNFNKRVLDIKFKGKCWIEGYWQDERYFINISNEIRNDFTFKENYKNLGKKYIKSILNTQSVAIHFRNFNSFTNKISNNLSLNYYTSALSYINSKINSPNYFIFVDEPSEDQLKFIKSIDKATIIQTNSEIVDLYLMSNCKHFIIANSSYSWWGAWLSKNEDKIIIAPKKKEISINSSFSSVEIPKNWIIL